MLYRYTASKDFAGDTWHQSLDEAKRSAEFEYGEALGAWEELPEAVAEGAEADYALGKARRQHARDF
jgi:hypothetical protein